MKLSKKLLSLLLCAIMIWGAISIGGVVGFATCEKGIMNNGLYGINIDINSAPFTTFQNYANGGYAYGKYGCAWFASARVNQLTGKGSTIYSGWKWFYQAASSYGFSTGQEPKEGSIICWSNGSGTEYEHVAIIEKIVDDCAIISQGGSWGSSDSAHGYCSLDIVKLSAIKSMSNYNFLGYVYFNSKPIGATDEITGGNGSIYVYGWAVDPDEESKNIKIHVYIGGPASDSSATRVILDTNAYRPDVAYGGNNYHGFKATISTNRTGSVPVYVYAIDSRYNDNPLLGSKTVTVTAPDTTVPKGSISATNNVAASQTVTLSMSDNAGLAGYYWGTSSSYSSNTYTSVSGTTASVTKTVSSPGEYYLTVKDTSGNLSNATQKHFYRTSLSPDGGSVSTTNIITASGNSFTLPTPTKSGYTFKNWNTASAGTGTAYTGTYKPSGNVTLYAQWTANTYTVSYNANGGTGAPSNQTKYYGTALTLSTIKPTRTEYTFKNWNTKADGTGTSYSAGSSYTANSAVTLYAQWTPNTYTVTYNANGGTGVPANQTKTYGTTLTLSSTKPTREGYTFLGWAETSTATTAAYQAGGSFTKDANTTLYAVWNKNAATYTVKYDANGGSGAPASQTKIEGTTLALSSTKPTRTGYTFKNWNTKADGTGTSYSSGASYTANAAVTLYAQWTPITYTVTYNANGGSGVPSSQTKTYGTTLTLSSTKPTRTGYTFKNWNTKADGTGTSYSAGASFTANSAVTLYAQWTANTYTVTYNANGGTGVPSSQTKTYDITLTLSNTKPTRTGYTFKNWNTKADGTGTSYSAGASYTANASVTLYAQWTANHTHSYTKTVTKPTCTEKGYTTYTCTCGDSYTGDYVDALDHNYVNGVCTRCGTPDDEYILNEAKKSAKTELELLKNEVVSTEAKEILENAENQIDKAESVDKINTIKNDAIKSAIEADLKSGNNVFDKSVIQVAPEKTIDYRSKVIIKATAANVPAGYHLVMVVDGKEIQGTNTEVTYEISELTRDVNYSVKVVDENGAVQKDSSGTELRKDGGKITCNAGFFKKLIAFFKGLFKSLPKVEVKP